MGSVEDDFFGPLFQQPDSPATQCLQREASDGEPRWRVLGEATQTLAQLALALREAGVGRVAQQWRNELLAVPDAQGRRIASVERGLAYPLGIATRAVHLVGLAPDGRCWVQQRAFDKAHDPGQWDTLMGGMVSVHDSLESALERETWEEAGLHIDALQNLKYGGKVALRKPSADGSDGGFVVEDVDWFLATVPDGMTPLNQDGEVVQFCLLDRTQLVAQLNRDEFTTEAALILLALLRDS
jgi:8-oxo-dGTP pyrophosphatase MutT (NUDIX family)